MAIKITKQMIEEAVRTYKHKHSIHFELTNELKPQTLKKAAKHIAIGINENDIIAVMAFKGMFGGGKDGMALSENRLYFSKDYSRFNSNKLSSVDISNFKTVNKCTSGSLKGHGLTIEYENGEKISFYTGIFTADILNFFKTLMILRGGDTEESENKAKKADPVPEASPKKAEEKPTETAEEIEKRLRAEMEDELKKQREKLEKEYAEKLKAATGSVSKPEPKTAPAPVKAPEVKVSAPAVTPAPVVKSESKASAPVKDSVSETKSYDKPQVNFESALAALDEELKDKRVDLFRHLPNGGSKYPTLFIPFELDGEVYVPTYMQKESDEKAEHQFYRIINIFDGKEELLDAAKIKANGDILSVFLISKPKAGYEETDMGDTELQYARQIFGFNYAAIPSYLVLGIYLNGNKFLDLQKHKIYDLSGCERYKNSIKEKDFVIACYHNGKHYIVEVRKPKIYKDYYYVNRNWCPDKEGTVSKIPYSLITYLLENRNGALNSKSMLPPSNMRCTIYSMENYQDAFYSQPILYTVGENEAQKTVPAPVNAPEGKIYTPAVISAPAVKTEPKVSAPVKPAAPASKATPAAPKKPEAIKESAPVQSSAKFKAKAARTAKHPGCYEVFDLFGEICICASVRERFEDKNGDQGRTYFYEYYYHSLGSQQEKIFLFTETVKTKLIEEKHKRSGPNFRHEKHSTMYGFCLETEILKASRELFSDTKDEGYGKAGRHGYKEYSKRLPEMEFSIYESKCCTAKHIGDNVFEEVVSGIKYPLHDSYPTNGKLFPDNYYCGAVIFENKIYPVYTLRFENSILAQYKDGKFITFDGQFLIKYYTYSLSPDMYIKFLSLNGRDTICEPKEGEYYELSYTNHSDYHFKNLLFMKPLKLTPIYGVLQATKVVKEHSYRGKTERKIDFSDSTGYSYKVLPYTIPDDTYDKITDKVCFARILAKDSDEHANRYAIVDKLYYGSEMEMQCISSNSTGHTLKQKGGSLTLSIPDRASRFTIKEGYEVLCTVCRNQDFASVNRESTLVYVNKVLKETKKEIKLPTMDKFVAVELTDIKNGDILYNYKTFIAAYNVTITDDDGMLDVVIDGYDLKEQRDTLEYLSLEEYAEVLDRKLISIDLLPCEIKGDKLLITTKNKEQIYLDEDMTHKVFDVKIPPKKVYAYHYGNTYYFATGERDNTCV